MFDLCTYYGFFRNRCRRVTMMLPSGRTTAAVEVAASFREVVASHSRTTFPTSVINDGPVIPAKATAATLRHTTGRSIAGATASSGCSTNSRTGAGSRHATTRPRNPTSASSRSPQSNSGYPLSTKPSWLLTATMGSVSARQDFSRSDAELPYRFQGRASAPLMTDDGWGAEWRLWQQNLASLVASSE